MAKRIDYKSQVGETFDSLKYGKAKCTSYLGINDKKAHMFEVEFLETKNINIVPWGSLRSGKFRDTELIKQIAIKNKTIKLKARNRIVKKSKSQNYVRLEEHRNILVLDIASYTTGWTLIVDDEINSSGQVYGIKGYNLYNRAKTQTDELRNNLIGIKIDCVVVESTYLSLNSKILEMLSEFRGMYQGIIKQQFHKIQIASWKHFHSITTGTREEQKQQSIKLAEILTGKKVAGDDEADSILMALYILKNGG